jgi:hypothetical protein
MPSLSQPIGSVSFNQLTGTVSGPEGGISNLLYTTVLNSAGNGFVVTNRVYAPTTFLVDAEVYNSSGDPFVVFT